MELKIFKTLWGHTGSFEAAYRSAVEAEFDGIEGPSPTEKRIRNGGIAFGPRCSAGVLLLRQ
jgi:hypothetical protein